MAMSLTVVVAFVVISIFSSPGKGGRAEALPGQEPEGETRLGDLLDP